MHSSEGIFTAETRSRVATALTNLGIACERLDDRPDVRAGVWVFFTEHAHDAVFSGGQIASHPTLALAVYTLEGGLDAASKQKLIAGATAIFREHAGSTEDPLPVYVVVREVPEVNWGMYGKQVSLAALRAHTRDEWSSRSWRQSPLACRKETNLVAWAKALGAAVIGVVSTEAGIAHAHAAG